jgi:AAA domain/DnaB-like helicase N terminal domain
MSVNAPKRGRKQASAPVAQDPPHNSAIIEREKDVLRWMLEREIIAPIDDPQDFYRHAHQLIWSAAQSLRAAGSTVDYLTVRAELTKREHAEIVGAVYLHELSRDSVRPSDAALVTAAEEIKKAAATRRLRGVLARHVTAVDICVSAVMADLVTFESRQVTTTLLDDAAVVNLPEPVCLVDAHILEQTLAVLVGDSGIGKTFLALDLGLSVAANRPWLGASIVKHGPVIYIAAEGAPAPRIGGWKIAHGYDLNTPIGLHTWPGAVNLLDPPAVAAFISTAKPIEPALVIVDTFARCFIGGDENSARDVGLAIVALDQIRTRLRATVLVIHHMNKGGTSERGSGALRAASDTMLYLHKSDDLLQLTCDKQKDIDGFEPINLTLEPPYLGAKTRIIRLAADGRDTDVLSDAQGKALHALVEMFGDAGATPAEWEAVLPFMHRATYFRARKVLIDRGYVRTDPAGRRYYPTAKPAVASGRIGCRTVAASESREVA